MGKRGVGGKALVLRVRKSIFCRPMLETGKPSFNRKYVSLKNFKSTF